MPCSQRSGSSGLQNTVSSVTPRELPSGLICNPKVCIDGKVYGHRYSEHRESRTRAGRGRRAWKAGERGPCHFLSPSQGAKEQEGPTMTKNKGKNQKQNVKLIKILYSIKF